MGADTETIHATCVAVGTHGVLIRGPSGAGKSDLALRLIHSPPSFGLACPTLVSDDRVFLAARDGELWAHAAPNLAGKLEVRGIGIVTVDHAASVAVRLVVDATDTKAVPRMPEDQEAVVILRQQIPTVALALCEPSTVAKVMLALARVL